MVLCDLERYSIANCWNNEGDDGRLSTFPPWQHPRLLKIILGAKRLRAETIAIVRPPGHPDGDCDHGMRQLVAPSIESKGVAQLMG